MSRRSTSKQVAVPQMAGDGYGDNFRGASKQLAAMRKNPRLSGGGWRSQNFTVRNDSRSGGVLCKFLQVIAAIVVLVCGMAGFGIVVDKIFPPKTTVKIPDAHWGKWSTPEFKSDSWNSDRIYQFRTNLDTGECDFIMRRVRLAE